MTVCKITQMHKAMVITHQYPIVDYLTETDNLQCKDANSVVEFPLHYHVIGKIDSCKTTITLQ